MKKYPVFVFLIILTISCNPSKKSENMPSTTHQNNLNTAQNPLLAEWHTPFGTPPFDQIKSADYLPAFTEAIKQHNKEIDQIVNNKEKPTFKNTVVALEQSVTTFK